MGCGSSRAVDDDKAGESSAPERRPGGGRKDANGGQTRASAIVEDDDPWVGLPSKHVPEPMVAKAQESETAQAAHDAAIDDDADALRDALREAGGEVDALLDDDEYTPLHSAAEYGSDEAVKVLIKAGALPHRGTAAGHTPLHCAAENGNMAALAVMLGVKRVRVDVHDAFGQTPLFLAAHAKQDDAIEALLDAGADPDITHTDPETQDETLAARAYVDAHARTATRPSKAILKKLETAKAKAILDSTERPPPEADSGSESGSCEDWKANLEHLNRTNSNVGGGQSKGGRSGGGRSKGGRSSGGGGTLTRSPLYLDRHCTSIATAGTDDEWEELLATPADLVLVDVHAEWCGPTECLGPSFSRLTALASPFSLIVATACADTIGSLAQFRGSATSTFLIYKHGSLAKVVTGPDEVALENAVANVAPIGKQLTADGAKAGKRTEDGCTGRSASDASSPGTDEAASGDPSIVLGIGWTVVASPDYATSLVPELVAYPLEEHSSDLSHPTTVVRLDVANLTTPLVVQTSPPSSSMATLSRAASSNSVLPSDAGDVDDDKPAILPPDWPQHGSADSLSVPSSVEDDAYALVPLRKLDSSIRRLVLVFRVHHDFTGVDLPSDSAPEEPETNRGRVLTDTTSINSEGMLSARGRSPRSDGSLASTRPVTPGAGNGDGSLTTGESPDAMYAHSISRNVLAILKPFHFSSYVRIMDPVTQNEVTSYSAPLIAVDPTTTFCPILILCVHADGAVAIAQADTYETMTDAAFLRSIEEAASVHG
ncbi:uncharacterized protein AMSG_06034 [Thecamonas trahens ATCC 50062]|uniref:Thioredoxin domain-containing protein n=1 Tax=Thecamonas trahens ATCC 50062 TaxID=461836 RepID=A0A0L0DEK1_THETB|nr:hypothetical protein AMSG_06034 [Thecamonas trahens ATCC 50062]KNC49758.1 hypothetical protein AMSG_06034 [Thecamonas trahens ATCC 50062]|eukprot:XP_013757544.1 hypothetical protein AMSG_06034 [Thecamonas trahens ATCC 50062]